MASLNDPTLRSWIDIPPTSDFPIQNLPFGVFVTEDGGPHLGVAIGGYILDLYALSQYGFLEDLDLNGQQPKVFRRRSLNPFIALGPPAWRAVRQRVSELLRHDNPTLRDHESAMHTCLVRQSTAKMLRPVKPRNYTLFSGEQAPTASANPLPTDWHQMPRGHHGRAGSVVVSGTAIYRPNGSCPSATATEAAFGPTQQLDFEQGVAFVNGQATQPGSTISVAEAEDSIFGVVLLTTWSARDIAQGEAGSFLGQRFGSSISPWVVTLDALEPFRAAGPSQLPEPLSYLRQSGLHHFDVQLQAAIKPATAATEEETVVSAVNFRQAYWSMAQQLAYQTSNGTPVQVGDLTASSPLNGPTPEALGSLLALSQGGTRAIPLNDGSTRTYLEDGDTVTLRGYGEKDGLRIGFGEVIGTVGR